MCIIINNNNKDKCQPQVTLVALATPFNILTVACGPCVALGLSGAFAEAKERLFVKWWVGVGGYF